MKSKLLMAYFLVFSVSSQASSLVKDLPFDEFAIRDESINFKILPYQNNSSFGNFDEPIIKVLVMCDKDVVLDAMYSLILSKDIERLAVTTLVAKLKKSSDYQYATKKSKEFEESGNIQAMNYWKDKALAIQNSEYRKQINTMNASFVKKMTERPRTEYVNMFKNKSFDSLVELRDSCRDMIRR